MSKRKDHPFVPVNLAAIPESLIESELFGYKKGAFTGADRDKMGYIELAEGGTLFLDEIGETPPMVQVKLLRVIQEKKFSKLGDPRERKCNVRFIFATNKDLRKLVEEGKFREDLYYRINVINIHIPPLRERREDIPYLLDHFLDKYCSRERKKVKGFTREAFELLMRYDYPGNVRELENIVERACVLSTGEYITVDLLPHSVRKDFLPLDEEVNYGLTERLEMLEKSLILDALKRNNYVKSRAARELGISERVLRYKISRLGIKDKPEKHEE